MTQGEAALCSWEHSANRLWGGVGRAARPIVHHTERRQTRPLPGKADLPGWLVIKRTDQQTPMWGDWRARQRQDQRGPDADWGVCPLCDEAFKPRPKG